MTRAALSIQRCFNHPVREAVARCPECSQFFCRECITEHDDRVMCSACLQRLAGKVPETKRRRLAVLLVPGQLLFGVMCAWAFFYFLGRVLVTIPPAFHEGTVWEQDYWDSVDNED